MRNAGVRLSSTKFHFVPISNIVYIVQYIVENTVGPLADEAAKQVAEMRPEVDKEIINLRRKRSEWEKSAASSAQKHVADGARLIEDQKRRLLEPYLSLRILDPAMGSGHFLVGAADFLSLAMATDPNLLPLDEMDEEDPQAFCKRLVVERCLYGVDLNPFAVELVKLSLWLHTVSKDKASYIAFVEKSIELIRASGLTSMIIPDTWMSLKFTEPARKLMLEATWLRNAVALPRTVFPDATVDTAIYVARKNQLKR